ncbi:MAG: YqaJ viral recombinase family protein [Candidatus Gastranaerophilales bacterium]|nr:YqaJ viral recombinase family protein [Candidatus Gastranaerophilales bacterium]
MFTKNERKNYIGGSDIAAVMGMSRWKTPFKLWLEKTGDAQPDDLSNVEAVQLGSELEEFIAQKFAKETGKQVRKQSKMYVHKDYPFMVAHIDRLITGTNEILECKTCSAYKKDEWDDESELIEINGKINSIIKTKIPQEYILQVIWYLGITGKKKAYIAVLIGGQAFKYTTVEFDNELFDLMVDMAKEFWNCVQTKTPPALTPNDSALLLNLFPSHDQDFIENQEIEENISKLQKVKDDISMLSEQKDVLEAQIKNIIGTHLGIMTENYKVTWKEQNQTKVDTNRLKADGLYEKYTLKSSFRRLYILKKKKAA